MPESSVELDTQETAERAAIEALSVRFRPALIGYFRRRLKDTIEAEDLAQEVFLRMLRRGNVRELDDVRGYIFETASSVLIDRKRRGNVRQRSNHESFDPQGHAGETPPIDRVFIGRESLSRVSVALFELPERTRTIFILRRLEGMRYSDIAQRLGISVSAVEKHVMRAMAHLVDRMRAE